MTDSLQRLLAEAKRIPMTEEQQEQQRRSFAYGNTAFENPQITRDLIDREAVKLLRVTDDGDGR